MKIDISEEKIDEIATSIGAYARTALIKKVYQLEDIEFVMHLRAAAMTNVEKVNTYLSQTKVNRRQAQQGIVVQVENALLATFFGLHVLAMKAVRDELVKRGAVEIYRTKGKLMLRYLQAAPATPA